MNVGGELSVPMRGSDYVELFRVRLTLMILVTVAVGFVLASPGSVDGWRLAGVLLGLGLVSAGSTALNQVLERDIDGRMERTQGRPLPQGRITSRTAATLGFFLCLVGSGILGIVAGWLTASLAAGSAAIYVFAYTPLKQRSSYNTLVGAISGALPPVIGWVGAAGRLDFGALVLFGILFVWQLIHLFAIAWMYREQYTRAGLVMVSVVDGRSGDLTMRLIVLSCLALVPVSVIPAFVGLAGLTYVIASSVLSAGFLLAGMRLARSRTPRDARRLFIASIAYLPLLLMVLVLDRAI